MTKKETLTESMRRLSDIVNEAEQLNEIDFNPREILKRGATAVGKKAGEWTANRLKAKRDKQVSSSSLRQHENLQALTKSFTRELGEDHSQWPGKLQAYFEKERIKLESRIYNMERKSNSIYSFPSQDGAAKMHKDAVMAKFDREVDKLLNACIEYARDPYSVEPQKHLSKAARNILEKVTVERPAAPTLPANHLNAVYEALAITTDKNFVPTGALQVLGFIMMIFTSVFMLQINDNSRREREKEEGRRRAERLQAIEQGARDSGKGPGLR